jgi:hypothetical protein
MAALFEPRRLVVRIGEMCKATVKVESDEKNVMPVGSTQDADDLVDKVNAVLCSYNFLRCESSMLSSRWFEEGIKTVVVMLNRRKERQDSSNECDGRPERVKD